MPAPKKGALQDRAEDKVRWEWDRPLCAASSLG